MLTGNDEIRLSPPSNPICQDSYIFKCRSYAPPYKANYPGQPSNLAAEKPADGTLLLTSPTMSQTESNQPSVAAPGPHCPCRKWS